MANGMRVLQAKLLYDGKGGGPKNEAAVLIDGNVIREIGNRDELVAPPEAVVTDLGDRTLMPGIIDAHTHFWGVRGDQLHTRPFEADGYRALWAASEAKRMLEAGITSARCCGSTVGPSVRRAINEGLIPGPRVIAAGDFVCPTTGTWDPDARFSLPVDWAKAQGFIADGADAMRELVRRRIRSGSNVIKIGTSKGNWDDTFQAWGDDGYSQVLSMTDEELRAVVDEAHRNKLRVASHSIGDAPVRAALEAGVDTIEHGFAISDETRQMLVDKNAIVVTTFLIMALLLEHLDDWKYSAEDRKIVNGHIDAQRSDFEKGLKAGIRYALGSDLVGAPTHPLDAFWKEFKVAVEYGMHPHEAIRAGTAVSADAIGMADTIGTIEPGKLADLIGLDGDPGADIGAIGRVEFVMLDGNVVLDRVGASSPPG
jgi:imidazolonepropionase-like amidohydrolase